MNLPAFLAAAKARKWQDGEWDCMLACADWVKARTDVDPAEPWRGRYHDIATRTAMLRTERVGFLGMARRACSLAGLDPAMAPRIGDVGLIRVMSRGKAWRVAGICLGGSQWWTATRGGLAVTADRVIAAWRVP